MLLNRIQKSCNIILYTGTLGKVSTLCTNLHSTSVCIVMVPRRLGCPSRCTAWRTVMRCFCGSWYLMTPSGTLVGSTALLHSLIHTHTKLVFIEYSKSMSQVRLHFTLVYSWFWGTVQVIILCIYVCLIFSCIIVVFYGFSFSGLFALTHFHVSFSSFSPQQHSCSWCS